MDPISIYFFALASILGIESSAVVSQKVTVTINPTENSFEVRQEDLFYITVIAADSLLVEDELQYIAAFDPQKGESATEGITVEHIVLSRSGEQLNALLKVRYADLSVLAETGIRLDTTSNGSFSLMNFPDWHIRSSEAVLKENYWVWPADKTVTFIMEPFKDIPQEYRINLRSALPLWEQWLESRPKL